MKQLVLAVALLGCGGSTKPPDTATPTEATVAEVDPELSSALRPLAFMLGNWALGEEGREFWVAAAGAMYGIAFPAPGEFEVMIIDDGDSAAMADGVLRFIAMPGGTTRTEFRVSSTAENIATFSNPEHDSPKTITYEMTDDALVATLDRDTAKPTRFVYSMTGAPYIAAIDQADRTFAADTLERGADGFMAHVTPTGFTLNRQGEVVTGDALRAMWDALTTENEVRWEPIHSRVSGDLGFTVGKATFKHRKTGVVQQTTTYCTIWERQADGSWKMRFDTGRLVNAVTPR